MNTKQQLHQLRLNEWSSRFSDQKASGLTVKQWCDQSNLSILVMFATIFLLQMECLYYVRLRK